MQYFAVTPSEIPPTVWGLVALIITTLGSVIAYLYFSGRKDLAAKDVIIAGLNDKVVAQMELRRLDAINSLESVIKPMITFSQTAELIESKMLVSKKGSR